MDAIRILENCSTARRGFKRGEVVAVGKDISAEDAAALVKLGRAVQVPQAQEQGDADAKRRVGRRG